MSLRCWLTDRRPREHDRRLSGPSFSLCSIRAVYSTDFLSSIRASSRASLTERDTRSPRCRAASNSSWEPRDCETRGLEAVVGREKTVK